MHKIAPSGSCLLPMVSAVNVSFSFTHVPHIYPIISFSLPPCSVATKNISPAFMHLYRNVSKDAFSSSGYELDSISENCLDVFL